MSAFYLNIALLIYGLSSFDIEISLCFRITVIVDPSVSCWEFLF